MAKEVAKQEEPKVEVSQATLEAIQTQIANLEMANENQAAEIAGLKELKEVDAGGEDTKIRMKKSFEPKFRTVRLRKFPIKGNHEDMGIVSGWSSRGAYQIVVRDGVQPERVDVIDIFFLGKEKNAEGKLQAEQVRLLDLLNQGVQFHCKILKTEAETVIHPTNEEIDVTFYNPSTGITESTGEKIDGFMTTSERKFLLSIPGVGEQWIDAMYCN